jgi:hypothetical protein
LHRVALEEFQAAKESGFKHRIVLARIAPAMGSIDVRYPIQVDMDNGRCTISLIRRMLNING